MQAWCTSPFLNSRHWSRLVSGEGLHRLSFTARNQQPAHPCLVPLPNTGPEHSWGSSSSKPHFSLLSSLGPALWTEESFEDVAWHRHSTVLGNRLWFPPVPDNSMGLDSRIVRLAGPGLYLSWQGPELWVWQTPPFPPWVSCSGAPVVGWPGRAPAALSDESALHPWCSPQHRQACPHTAGSGTQCPGWGFPSRRSARGSSGPQERGWRTLTRQKTSRVKWVCSKASRSLGSLVSLGFMPSTLPHWPAAFKKKKKAYWSDPVSVVISTHGPYPCLCSHAHPQPQTGALTAFRATQGDDNLFSMISASSIATTVLYHIVLLCVAL